MIHVTVRLEEAQLNAIKKITNDRGISLFIRECINHYFRTAGEEKIAEFRKLGDEMERLDHMRQLIAKETLFRSAFNCIRRSGFYVDQMKERLDREYPKGVLVDEKRTVDYLLDQREQISRALVKFIPESEK